MSEKAKIYQSCSYTLQNHYNCHPHGHHHHHCHNLNHDEDSDQSCKEGCLHLPVFSQCLEPGTFFNYHHHIITVIISSSYHHYHHIIIISQLSSYHHHCHHIIIAIMIKTHLHQVVVMDPYQGHVLVLFQNEYQKLLEHSQEEDPARRVRERMGKEMRMRRWWERRRIMAMGREMEM